MPENSSKTSRKIAILLGGDLGDEQKVFSAAIRGLADGGVENIQTSSLYRTKPVDCVPGTPDFYNQAVTGSWRGTPLELLKLTQGLERAAGRPEKHRSDEARVLDCDIILFGDEVVDLPKLQIPHPRAQSRVFVLEPLAEIAGDWRFPEGNTVAEALEKLKSSRF